MRKRVPWILLIRLKNSVNFRVLSSHEISKVLVTQSCPTVCDPIDCSLPGSSVLGILQARILEWIATPFSIRYQGKVLYPMLQDKWKVLFPFITTNEYKSLWSGCCVCCPDPSLRIKVLIPAADERICWWLTMESLSRNCPQLQEAYLPWFHSHLHSYLYLMTGFCRVQMLRAS